MSYNTLHGTIADSILKQNMMIQDKTDVHGKRLNEVVVHFSMDINSNADVTLVSDVSVA